MSSSQRSVRMSVPMTARTAPPASSIARWRATSPARSGATVSIWFVSRTFGLPFGAEAGQREQVGLADAAADLFEVFTALLLLIWLRGAAGRPVGRLAAVGAVAATALIGAWVATRGARLFDPDPRAVALPELVDASAIAFLIAAVVLFAGLRMRWLGEDDLRHPSAYSVLGSLLLTAAA